jgi:hypothetical protein
MRKQLAAAVAAASTVAAAAGPGVARAVETATPATTTAAVVLVDGGGDVWTYSDTTVGFTPADRAEADVLRARVTLADQNLRIREKFADLRVGETQWYRARVRTPGGTYWYVLEAAKGHWAGKVYQEVQGEWVARTAVRCHIDYDTHVVKLDIPWTVLGDPAWVQVRLQNDLGLKDHNTFFTDNPENHTEKGGFTERLVRP